MVSSVKQVRPSCRRYKGVEGFLRRIAFNLGNSPSQTEVKIISCIPIDVTDLQQKIHCLERQLALTQCPGKLSRSQAALPVMVNTQLRVAYPTSDVSSADQPQPLFLDANLSPPASDCPKNEHRTSAVPKDLPSPLSPAQGPTRSQWIRDPGQAEARRGKQMPEKHLTHLVYYAQTTGSPFMNYKKINTSENRHKDETLDRTYLSSVMERQYRAGELFEGLSQESAPVCRDVTPAHTSDDMCSCCRGHFFNLDSKMTTSNYSRKIDSNNYYDAKLYDMKPVKEISDKTKKRTPEIDSELYPEYYPFKPEYSVKSDYLASRSHNGSKTVKFPKRKRHTKHIFLQNDSSQTDGFVEFSHVYTKPLSIRHKPRCNTAKPVAINVASTANNKSTNGCMDSKLIQTLSSTKLISNSTNLNKEISENVVRVDQATNNTECTLVSNINKVTFKDAECLAIAMDETQCQTDPSKGAQSELTNPPKPDNTESTLNQIKSILQTVLTEVKTNNRMQPIVENKETKDAIVQKASVPSPDCERLLGSYTYSPYAMHNPYEYVPSCSRCLPPYCSSMMKQTHTMPRAVKFPSTDLNCVQNFPVLVHRTFATQACCPDRSSLMQPKQTSTHTLQEPPKKRSTETDKLIKEIYKSIALNIDCPMKTTSHAAINEAKSNRNMLTEFTTANTMTQGREEIIFRGDVGTSKNAMRMIENHISQSTLDLPQRHGGSFHQRPKVVTSAMRRQCNFNEPDTKPVANEEPAESASDNEIDHHIAQPSAIPAKSPPITSKQGFFGKVVSSVLKRMRKNEEQQPQKPEKGRNANTQDSDWSDYEVAPSPRVVKHVSYAPAERQPWGRIMQDADAVTRGIVSTSRSRRLTRPNCARWERDGGEYRPHNSPRYAPRSALRPCSGNSQVRRTALRPHPSHRPQTPPDIRRTPQTQQDWRPYTDHISLTNNYRSNPRPTPGIKLTNKTWMRKPVYHLGFACGPEKRKIMMQ